MRCTKSLLFAALILALGAGTALADCRDDAYSGPMPEGPSDGLALEQGDVIYIYPMAVTEYYLLIPGESSELPG